MENRKQTQILVQEQEIKISNNIKSMFVHNFSLQPRKANNFILFSISNILQLKPTQHL